MPEPREALLVMKRMKFPVASADGVRQEIREFQPGEFLPRADWDRAPARSRRSMGNTGFIRDPLNVEINPQTGEAMPMPVAKPSVTVLGKNGYDRRLMAQAKQANAVDQPVKRKRGRPPKVKG